MWATPNEFCTRGLVRQEKSKSKSESEILTALLVNDGLNDMQGNSLNVEKSKVFKNFKRKIWDLLLFQFFYWKTKSQLEKK